MPKISIDVDVWGFEVIFYDDVNQANREHSLDLDDLCCFTFEDASKIIIIINDTGIDLYSTEFLKYLSHECNHAAMRILERVGVTFSPSEQEALCYTQDFIFSTILKKLSTLE